MFENVGLYRQIQIFATLLNDIQQRLIFPSLMLECTVALGVGLAILVHTPATSDNIPIFVVILLACLDMLLFLLFCLGVLAGVYKASRVTSEKLKSDLPNIIGGLQRKWTRKFLMSCGVLKMKFGGSNFVEELTPLNCLSHAIDLTVQVLLLWGTQ